MKCWYCGVTEMSLNPALGSGWFQCTSCGATWSNDPLFQKGKKKAKK